MIVQWGDSSTNSNQWFYKASVLWPIVLTSIVQLWQINGTLYINKWNLVLLVHLQWKLVSVMHLFKSSLRFKEGDPHYTQNIVMVPIPDIKQYSGKSRFHPNWCWGSRGPQWCEVTKHHACRVHGANVQWTVHLFWTQSGGLSKILKQ